MTEQLLISDRLPETAILEQHHDVLQSGLLEQLLNAVPNVFMILNDRRQIVYTNERILSLARVEQSIDVLGMRPGEALDCGHADAGHDGCGTSDFCKTCGAYQAIQQGLQQQAAVEECRILRKDGAALDLRVWGTPLAIGDESFVVFSAQDISDEKRRRALERIFFHDILNTASALVGFSDVITGAAPAELDMISSHLQMLSERLIEEIQVQKDLIAAETHELHVHPMTVDALSMLADLQIFYSGHQLASGKQIVIDHTSDDVRIQSDQTLLWRVLGNMVKNALEASSAGDMVTLHCQHAGDTVIFGVHNPAFMARNVQLQVFKRSFTTKGDGRGLGTYSIKLLTEQYLGGEVSFHSTREGGTTFMARFPLVLDERGAGG